MSNQNRTSNLIIARGITKKDGNKPGQVITKLFMSAEEGQQFFDQLQTALTNQEDGISITLLEGEGKNGAFGMVTADALEARQERQQQGGQQRAYTAKPQANTQAAATTVPQTGGYKPKNGGYKPKTPGYQGR